MQKLREAMPLIIRKYNDATNTPNTKTEGYHETLTLLYLRAINDFTKNLPKDHCPFETYKLLIKSPIAEKSFPFLYYSKELLFSIKARKTWVEPDL